MRDAASTQRSGECLFEKAQWKIRSSSEPDCHDTAKLLLQSEPLVACWSLELLVRGPRAAPDQRLLKLALAVLEGAAGSTLPKLRCVRESLLPSEDIDSR